MRRAIFSSGTAQAARGFLDERQVPLVFYDQTGTGRWRLTQSSEVRFEAEFRRRLK